MSILAEWIFWNILHPKKDLWSKNVEITIEFIAFIEIQKVY